MAPVYHTWHPGNVWFQLLLNFTWLLKLTMKRIVLITVTVLLLVSAVPATACTTFLMSGRYTPDGRPLLFKNRDTDQLQNSLAFFTDGRYNYIGIVNGDTDWSRNVWGGYNETGFAIMNSAAYNNNIGDTTRFADQEGVVMKLALQNCRTLRDFEMMLDTLPKPLGVDANFGVIDAYGGAAFYETGNYGYHKVDANDPAVAPRGLLVRTNHSMNDHLREGFGFNRFNTATEALNTALDHGSITPQNVFSLLSRNLKHSLTGTDLMTDLPGKGDEPRYCFFIDYIPRYSTASAMLIVGAPDEQHAGESVMYSIIGFPLTSVVVPVWVAGGDNLPRVVSMDSSYRSPLCTAALKFKEQCFPITYDRGTNYINLSAVVNAEGTGYMQLLAPVEKTILTEAGKVTATGDGNNPDREKITAFYRWLDGYLKETYAWKFGYNLSPDE